MGSYLAKLICPVDRRGDGYETVAEKMIVSGCVKRYKNGQFENTLLLSVERAYKKIITVCNTNIIE